ncbi:MAG TPA: glucosamine-6-phosphate deaminase [Clostridiales bacterium]|nr:glucosamine-6-phosphate deaminase [Clostridiales bacterium]
MKIYQADSYVSMCRKAANIISAQVILYPRSVLGLATGSTPLGIYRQLIDWYKKGDLDFAEVTTFNLDEYAGMSSDHPQSYRSFMNENLFDQININRARINFPDGTAEHIQAECSRYDDLIRSKGDIDMQLLGLGHNGHIGFNEPGIAFEKETHYVQLSESTRQANAQFFTDGESVPDYAFTMGIKAIMQAKKILLAVSGSSKATILKRALTGPVLPEVPGSILQLHPDLTVVADSEALSDLLKK